MPTIKWRGLRHLLRVALQRAFQCDVYEAADGASALVLARAVHPFLAILDIEMPPPDGLAVCRALKADPATSAGYVWICSGSADLATLCVDAGADGYLRKPFRLGDLVARVKDYALVP